jgi:hypothetical protein
MFSYSNYAAMNEKINFEEVDEIINSVKAAAIRTLESHEGTGNQFITSFDTACWHYSNNRTWVYSCIFSFFAAAGKPVAGRPCGN